MATTACQQCGKSLEVPPSRTKRTKYCGRACYAAALSARMKGAGHFMYGRKHTAESLDLMRLAGHRNAKRGRKSPTWTGGRYKMRGYWMVSLDGMSPEDRALAEPMVREGRNYVPEHRVVMARTLGRPLEAREVVHHRNGIKTDNRPENLQLHDHSEHKKAHWRVLKELRALRRENERLRALLSAYSAEMFPIPGVPTSSQPA